LFFNFVFIDFELQIVYHEKGDFVLNNAISHVLD